MLHSGNSVAAVLDLAVSHRHRTFSLRACALVAATVAAYWAWLPYSAHRNSGFPYPFMCATRPLPPTLGARAGGKAATVCAQLSSTSLIFFPQYFKVWISLENDCYSNDTRLHEKWI